MPRSKLACRRARASKALTCSACAGKWRSTASWPECFRKGPKAAYPWVLKGGYAMELRMHSARTTKDIDLTLHDGTRLSKRSERAG